MKLKIAVMVSLPFSLLLFGSNAFAGSVSTTVYLPVASITPGATNPSVTQSNISSTICVSGYSSSVRPAESYTSKLKAKQLKSYPYSKYGTTDTKLFEEDHLISLELGGSPSNIKNLWPELWDGPYGARTKDKLENKLHELVCAGNMPLVTAQRLISQDWYSAYETYVLLVSPSEQNDSNTSLSSNNVPSYPSPSATTTIPAGATGLCKDGTFSFATKHQGMCSKHGGVQLFY